MDRFDRFTEDARRTLTFAQDEAQRFNHSYIGTEHLLLGLLRVPGGSAAAALEAQGVHLDKARTAVDFIIGRGESPHAGEVGLTHRAKRVIELAIEEARQRDDRVITDGHLLLGLVREGEGIAAAVLQSLGVELDPLREAVAPSTPDEGRSPTRANSRAGRGPGAGRQRIASGSPWEARIGFSRAVRIGDRVLVSGTAPIWPDGSCDPDPERQAGRCLEIILAALAEAGASAGDVVRTRTYLVDAADAEAVGRAHAEVFGDVRPTSTMVVVSGFLDPRWKVEFEAEAQIS